MWYLLESSLEVVVIFWRKLFTRSKKDFQTEKNKFLLLGDIFYRTCRQVYYWLLQHLCWIWVQHCRVQATGLEENRGCHALKADCCTFLPFAYLTSTQQTAHLSLPPPLFSVFLFALCSGQNVVVFLRLRFWRLVQLGSVLSVHCRTWTQTD